MTTLDGPPSVHPLWVGVVLLLATAACRGSAESPTGPESTTSGQTPALATASASNTWSTRAADPSPHSGFAISELENAAGQSVVYIFGGVDEEGSTGFGIFTYNVATDTWGGAPRSFLPATDLNGVGRVGAKFYVTGGQSCCDENFRTYNTTWMYNTATSNEVFKADVPRATTSGVTGSIKGQIYVLPGYCSGESVDPGHCATFGPTRQLYRYDPPTNTWITRRQAPHFHASGASAVINDKFYVVGGTNQGAYLDVYDPATNTWQTKAPIPTAGEQLFGAAILSQFFVISWSHPDGKPVISKAYLYDPVSNTWKSRAAPPNGIAGPIAKVMVNGQPRLFLPGGFGPSYLYTP
jgi:Kelch motif